MISYATELKGCHIPTAMQGQDCYDIVDLPQDNGTNATNNCSLEGKVVFKITIYEKIYYATVSQCPVTSANISSIMPK